MHDGQHLVLVGMTGSGKSTVSRVLGLRLGRRVVDIDAEIERRAGKSVRRIFADEGEARFRSLESEALRDAITDDEPAVIAPGGGVVVAEANRVLLRSERVRVAWLCADVDTLADRVGHIGHHGSHHGSHRPLLDDDPRGTLQRMLREREPWYREVADVVVLVDNRSVNEVVEAILR